MLKSDYLNKTSYFCGANIVSIHKKYINIYACK